MTTLEPPPQYDLKLPRSWEGLIPLLGPLWLMICGWMPGSYFAKVHVSLWSGQIDLVPVSAVAGIFFFLAWASKHPKQRRFWAFLATMAWAAVTVALFYDNIPIAAGFAAILVLRSAVAYLGTPHGS